MNIMYLGLRVRTLPARALVCRGDAMHDEIKSCAVRARMLPGYGSKER
jgi:hypothetical protein